MTKLFNETVGDILVLNLIINGLPSILFIKVQKLIQKQRVLNLIINGLPSIHSKDSIHCNQV